MWALHCAQSENGEGVSF